MLDVLYDAAACEKEKLVVPGAGHAEAAYGDHMDIYYDTVKAFIERYVK
jgi:hypothetical protein